MYLLEQIDKQVKEFPFSGGNNFGLVQPFNDTHLDLNGRQVGFDEIQAPLLFFKLNGDVEVDVPSMDTISVSLSAMVMTLKGSDITDRLLHWMHRKAGLALRRMSIDNASVYGGKMYKETYNYARLDFDMTMNIKSCFCHDTNNR